MAPLTKLLLLALAVAFLAAAVNAQFECNRLTCVDNGELCDDGACTDPESTACTRDCRTGAVCAGPTGYATCRVDSDNLPCQRNSDCDQGDQAIGTNICFLFRCQPEFGSGDGVDNDKCHTGDDCDNSIDCKDGKCVGKEDGESCSNSDNCKYNSYCTLGTNVCAKRPVAGEACPEGTCHMATCVGGECVARGASGEGAECVSVDSNCGPGLYCNGSNVCVTTPAPSLELCNPSPNNCTNGEVCVCDTLDGVYRCANYGNMAAGNCVEHNNEVTKCLMDNQCSDLSSFSSSLSCAFNHCGGKQEAYLRCTTSQVDGQKDPSCKSPAAALVAGLAALF